MQTYLVVDATHMIVNIVRWDGVSRWTSPPSCRLVRHEGGASIGWCLDGHDRPYDPSPKLAEPVPGAGGDMTVL